MHHQGDIMETIKIEYVNTSTKVFPGFHETELGKFSGTGKDIIGKKYADELFSRLPKDGAIISHRFNCVEESIDYNFFTDHIVSDVELDMDALRKYCYTTHRKAFRKYLADCWVTNAQKGIYTWVKTAGLKTFMKNEQFDTECTASYYPVIMTEFYIITSLNDELNEKSIIRAAGIDNAD